VSHIFASTHIPKSGWCVTHNRHLLLTELMLSHFIQPSVLNNSEHKQQTIKIKSPKCQVLFFTDFYLKFFLWLNLPNLHPFLITPLMLKENISTMANSMKPKRFHFFICFVWWKIDVCHHQEQNSYWCTLKASVYLQNFSHKGTCYS
jgi:hypothetical protein